MIPLLIRCKRLIFRMKKSILLALFSLLSMNLRAQVFAGNAEIDGVKKDGFYIYLKGNDDQIFSSWKNYVKKFGAVEKSKNNVLLSSNTRLPEADKKPYSLSSKLFWESEKYKLFVVLSGSGADVVKSGHEDYRAASNWLENFGTLFQAEEGVRIENEKLEELKKNKSKLEKTKDRLTREMEANVQQTEFLMKKLEDAKFAKERIITNQLQNKKDLQLAEESINQQLKQVETAKQKIK